MNNFDNDFINSIQYYWKNSIINNGNEDNSFLKIYGDDNNQGYLIHFVSLKKLYNELGLLMNDIETRDKLVMLDGEKIFRYVVDSYVRRNNIEKIYLNDGSGPMYMDGNSEGLTNNKGAVKKLIKSSSHGNISFYTIVVGIVLIIFIVLIILNY